MYRLRAAELTPAGSVDCDQDLAGVGVGLHVKVGVGHLRQGKQAVDHGVQTAVVEQG